MSTGRPDTLHLADGALAYANATSLLAYEGRTVAAGNPVFPWPVSDTAIQDSLLGVAIAPRGRASLIRAPHPGKRAMHPRLLAGRAGIDVLFAERDEGGPVHLTNLITGSLWTGTYIGTWTNLRRLGLVTDGRLAAHESSRWFGRGDSTVLYHGFDRRATQSISASSGLIRLWVHGGRSGADTLLLSHEFFGLSADTAADHDVIAFIQPDTNAFGRPANSRVWVTEWSPNFRVPQQLTFDGAPAIRVNVRIVSRDFVAFSWQTRHWDTFVLRARRGPTGYSALGIDTLGVGSGYTVHATRSGSVLLFRADPARRRLHVHQVTADGTTYLGHTPSGDAVLIPSVVALSDHEFLHLAHSFTGRGDAPVVSELTHVHVVCA